VSEEGGRAEEERREDGSEVAEWFAYKQKEGEHE
jgi:hypothetical protein